MAKIVFCEDEKMLQMLLRSFLRSAGHEIYVASDGIEGLEVIERERPDLVLTDISMPHDGFQLAQTLRADPRFVSLPLIFITGFAYKYDEQDANCYNPIGYLMKPFAAMDLQITIEAALRAKR